VSNLVPREVYRMAIKHRYGDHVDWITLENYSIADSWWRRELVGEADELFTSFIELVNETSLQPLQPYTHFQLFRAPDSINDLWITEVSLASDYILHGIDKVNIVLNGGIFSSASHQFGQYSSHSERERLKLLKELGEIVNNVVVIEEVVLDFLAKARDRGFQNVIKANLEENLQHYISCLYSTWADRNLTFFNTIMDALPEAQLADLGQELVMEAFNVINSLEAESNMNAIMSAMKKTLRKTDFDGATGAALISFLRARSLVLGLDLHQVFTRLDQVHHQLGEGWWRVTTGQWPEMVQFVSTFTLKTVKSERFWQNLDNVYHGMVADARKMFGDRQKMLEEVVSSRLVPTLRALLAGFRAARDKGRPEVTDLISRIEAVDLNPALYRLADRVTGALSREFLACFTELHGKPDFAQLSLLAARSPVVGFLRPLLEADWPEAQAVPAGLPEFLERLQEAVLRLVTSVLGSCSNPGMG
jgi:hypothetical protein